MTNYIKYAVLGIAALLIGLFIGSHLGVRPTVAGVSPTGSTGSTAKFYSIIFAPATGSATSTSILNGDANDRIIETAKISCTGLGQSFTAYTGTGLANLIINAATTSTSAPNTPPTTNLVLDNSDTIATTTAALAYLSSTTPGSIGGTLTNRIWAANTYLTFWSNATNTAVCTVGVSAIPE